MATVNRPDEAGGEEKREVCVEVMMRLDIGMGNRHRHGKCIPNVLENRDPLQE